MLNLKFVNHIGQRIRDLLSFEIPDSVFIWMQILGSSLFCLMPIFMNLTYRSNIFLTWEGAYRLMEGQVPYRDFGIPLGIGFWLTPALFFKLFGPFFSSLLKAQVFLNLISLVSIRVIFKKLGLSEPAILLIILVNCISFVYINIWPWYNHTVYVFQLISIMFLILYIKGGGFKYRYGYLGLSALFSVMAFFTKQDGGAFSILINGVLVTSYILIFRPSKYYDIGLFTLFISILLFGYIFLFKNHDFGYWFNYGQYPHYSRVNLWDILNKFFGDSMFLKFYLAFGIMGCLFFFLKDKNKEKLNESTFLVIAICLLILSQVVIIQVTSFSPATGILYYHTFGILLVLFILNLPLKKSGVFLLAFISIMIMFSDSYWLTAQNQLKKYLPDSFVVKNQDVVSLDTWAVKEVDDKPPVKMVKSELQILGGLKLPEQTLSGIEDIMNLPVYIEKQSNTRVLNMSELTFLTYEMNYTLLKGQGIPLWYHKGVCLFDREIALLCDLINKKQFDIILFEHMDYVQDFYPYAVRDCAIENYKQVLEFEGPTGAGNKVEVYILPE